MSKPDSRPRIRAAYRYTMSNIKAAKFVAFQYRIIILNVKTHDAEGGCF
jgi:hypothetical protein